MLIVGCDQLSVSPSVTINFSVPMMARIMKPCIVIVLDMLYKHVHVPLTSFHAPLTSEYFVGTSSKILKCISL